MELQNTITQLLTLNPSKRPTLEQFMGHLWLSQGEEISVSPSIKTVSKHQRPTTLAFISDLDNN
jgi:hypothetical protein